MTHSFNSEQRFMDLPFTRAASGSLIVDAPCNANLAPPRRYLLIVVDNKGVLPLPICCACSPAAA